MTAAAAPAETIALASVGPLRVTPGTRSLLLAGLVITLALLAVLAVLLLYHGPQTRALGGIGAGRATELQPRRTRLGRAGPAPTRRVAKGDTVPPTARRCSLRILRLRGRETAWPWAQALRRNRRPRFRRPRRTRRGVLPLPGKGNGPPSRREGPPFARGRGAAVAGPVAPPGVPGGRAGPVGVAVAPTGTVMAAGRSADVRAGALPTTNMTTKPTPRTAKQPVTAQNQFGSSARAGEP